MATIRNSKKENPFVMLDKRPLDDVRLSWEAKGLHSYLMSKPDDWTVNVRHLIKQSRNGRDATYRIVNELILAGYIERNQEQNEDGTFGEIEYIVHELPKHLDPFEMPKTKKKTKTEPHPESQDTDKNDKKPHPGFPDTENPYISNKEVSNNDLKNDDDDNAHLREEINHLVFNEFKGQIPAEQFAKILQRISSKKKTTNYKAYLVKCVQSEIEELNRKESEQAEKQVAAATQETKPSRKSRTTIKTVIPVIVSDNINAPTVEDLEYEKMLELAREMQEAKKGKREPSRNGL